MKSPTRLFCALFIFLSALVAPLPAITLPEMKAVESKVKTLVAKNMPAVVSLFGEKSSGAGSGVIVSADGIILTAAHVTQGNEEMVVLFPDGKETRCKVLGADYDRDVSVAKIIPVGTYPFAEIGNSDALQPTTVVIALGHPGGFDVRRTPPVRIGRISMTNMGGFLVSDCTLTGGDSGGPLFDLEGKVVGIHSSIAETLTFNRDAPTSAIKAHWDQLLEGKRWGKPGGARAELKGRIRPRAVLGGVFDAESKEGVSVKEVQPKSPLEEAGIRAGDVLLKLGGEDVKTSEAVTAKLRESKPGDKMEIVWRREGAEQMAEVTLISQIEMMKRMGGELGRPSRGERKPEPESQPEPAK
ncbi:MAG: S1C family serine protease [Chthoniobacter sp.]|nr:S1C family serine protease [Chthoniobacter sp.]